MVCFLANVGQEEDWAAVEKKALALGAERMVIEDLQREFVEELVFRAIQCNAIYEDRYLLGTSLARPVIARAQVRVAEQYNCEFLSHGCTGKGVSDKKKTTCCRRGMLTLPTERVCLCDLSQYDWSRAVVSRD